jgi:hypothetical protein
MTLGNRRSNNGRGRPVRAVSTGTYLVVLAYVALVAAWVVGNPPFAAPDEPAQFIRGVALAGGDTGTTPRYEQVPRSFLEDGFRRLTRVEDIPADLAPVGQLPCFAFDAHVTADCDDADTPFALGADERLALDPNDGVFPMIARLDAVEGPDGETELRTTSYQATYPPALLGVAGLAGRLGWSPESGNLFGRAAAASMCLALVAAGWYWLLDGPGLLGPRLAGGMLALTPMALFLLSTVSASGVEIAASFAWVCGLIRLSRGSVTALTTVGIAVAGAILMSARQIGPAWLAASVVAVAAAGGIPLARRRVAEHPAAAAAGGVLIAVAVAFSTWWSLFVYPASPKREEPSLGGLIGQAVVDLGRLSRESVGVFGWLDTTPPIVVHLGWGAMLCVLVALGFLLGRRFDRRLLGAIGVGGLGVALLFSGFAYTQHGAAQGRWVLPAALALPLVAGEALSRRWPSGVKQLPVPLGAIVACALAVCALQGASLWANARRYAVGSDGPLMFIGKSQWAPPGGWGVVAVAGGLGFAALVAGAVAIVTADRSVEGAERESHARLVHAG